MFPEAGEKLGPYEILGELGGGGMARVYRAWDGRLHREVAIKVIDDRFSMPGIGERFLREARAASGLNHPNICTIFDIGEQDGAPYLVMELLEGETLRERISVGGISVEDILRYGAEVSDALAAAHARGIVHRDVKPANVFLVKKPNGSAQAKVLDFGLAKVEQYASEERDFASHLTSMGATVGTVSYMSPEQARGEKLDARSDLFSLGIVMYEMATGQLPFQGNTSALVFVQLLGQMAPEAVRKLNGQIPPDLDQLIMKLLSKNPRGRYQSATELCDELHELAEKRSGWLTRMKPPPVQPAAVAAREPLARPPRATPNPPLLTPKIVDTPRLKSAAEQHPSDEVLRALPARPGDPQGVRAPGRRRKESAEHKSQQQKKVPPRIEVRPENRGEGSSGQVPAARGPMNVIPSGIRPVRTSIATNPKISYPAAAPYQSGLHRAASTDVSTTTQSGEQAALTGAGAPGLSGLRQVVRDPRPSGVRAAERSPFAAGISEEEPVATATSEGGASWKWIALAIAMLVLVGGLLAWKFGWLGGAAPMQGGILLLTHLRNSTGDARLDVAVMEGLEIELLESRGMALRGAVVYGAQYRRAGISGEASPDRLREIAGRAGAARYLTGEIKGSDGAGTEPLVIGIDVMDAASGKRLTHFNTIVANKSTVLDAVDGIAAQLRSAMGESDTSIAGASTPLRTEGSLSVDALYAYYEGQEALQNGLFASARDFFERAAEADPHFVLAHIQLAAIYGELLSKMRAAAAAAKLPDVIDATTDRVQLLAQFRREIGAAGDLDNGLKTIQRFQELYPLDLNGWLGLGEVLRMEGRFAESLQAVEKAYPLASSDAEVYWQAEQAMLCVNRFDSVGQMDATMLSLGLRSGPDAMIAYYLLDRRDDLNRTLAEVKGDPAWLTRLGFMLDDAGRFTEGEAVWRGMSSTGPVALEKATPLTHGALDRALSGECKSAMEMLHQAAAVPRGVEANFDAGMAAALCGDIPVATESLAELMKRPPQDTDVREYMVPDLRAAIELKAGHASSALGELKTAGSYDLVSLTPYLRGLAHEAANQPGLAIADFEIELAHRGALAERRSTVYPLSQLHIARAYAASGDNSSSVTAYRTFAELWKSADPNQRLVAEARAHTH